MILEKTLESPLDSKEIKPVNPKEWSNYCIIALISHSSKVMLKITADSDCSHEIKRPLLLGRRTMTNLHLILKSRDTTLPAKVHMVKAVVF